MKVLRMFGFLTLTAIGAMAKAMYIVQAPLYSKAFAECSEAEFLDNGHIGTKVLGVFLRAIHSHLSNGFYPPPPPPGAKLV
jgi:hypothetical protein